MRLISCLPVFYPDVAYIFGAEIVDCPDLLLYCRLILYQALYFFFNRRIRAHLIFCQAPPPIIDLLPVSERREDNRGIYFDIRGHIGLRHNLRNIGEVPTIDNFLLPSDYLGIKLCAKGIVLLVNQFGV